MLAAAAYTAEARRGHGIAQRAAAAPPSVPKLVLGTRRLFGFLPTAKSSYKL